MTDKPAPSATQSVQFSAMVHQRNIANARAALAHFDQGQLQVVLQDYLAQKYGIRRGVAILMNIAHELDRMSWSGEVRK